MVREIKVCNIFRTWWQAEEWNRRHQGQTQPKGNIYPHRLINGQIILPASKANNGNMCTEVWLVNVDILLL